MANKVFVQGYSAGLTQLAQEAGLMHAGIAARNKQNLVVSGNEIVNFTNCSYLGLDTDPEMIAAAKRSLDQWGLHFCCARSRFSTNELFELEEKLSELFGARAVTFPSVTTTHYSVLPLVANGMLLNSERPVNLIFDRFAHASMQALIPMLETTAKVCKIPHNDLGALVRAMDPDCTNVYLCDGVYSMGGTTPINDLLTLQREQDLVLYIDDAHGTSIYGDKGQGFVANAVEGDWPDQLFVNFSMAKGFGCNGGGVLVPDSQREQMIRHFGQSYAFSGPVDFSIVGAAIKSIEYHQNGTVKKLQTELRRKVSLVDQELFEKEDLPFSPIRMVDIGDENVLLEIGKQLLGEGYFVPTVFFPVVPRGKGQLRLCITVNHSDNVLRDVSRKIKSLLSRYQIGRPCTRDDAPSVASFSRPQETNL